MSKIKKITALVLATAMLMTMLVGCSSSTSNDSNSFKAGTYQGKGNGYGGELVVDVTVTESEITDITIVSHGESAGISDPAIERLPSDILSAQGLGVDIVSGATFTSNAIIDAVTDALTQAGGNIDYLKTITLSKQAKEDEVIDTDVLVVGGGMAGLAAAIAAANEGAKVVLVEKMASLGGASITCGGEIIAAGTDMQKEQGITDTTKALADYWINVGGGNVNKEKLTYIAENSGNTVEWLAENGVQYGEVTFSYNYPNQDPLRNHSTIDGTGASFINPLVETAQKLGVEIYTETPAVSLIEEDGVILGANCENEGRKVTVNAKSTILATGGYANNAELMAEYAPEIGASGTFLGEAHQGDGLIMAREVGANIIANGGAIANPMDGGPTKFADAGGTMLNVTPEGKRFMNENEYWFTRSANLYFEQGFNYYYGIVDSSFVNDGFEEAIEKGTVIKADSIEELAEKLDMDPAVLTATVERYNEICKTGKDTDFNKPQVGKVGAKAANTIETTLLNPIEEGAFYAIKFATNSVTGTFGGPETTLDGEVVSTTGEIIEGLYAAGEVANGDLLNLQYPCSGSSIQFCASLGRSAGIAAATFATK